MPNRRNAIYSLLIACLVTGLFTGAAFFFKLAYVLFGLLFSSMIWSWLAVRWIGITRRTRTTRAQAGRYLEESFTVTNRAWIPKLFLEVRDYSTLPDHRASHVVPSLNPRARHAWSVQTMCLSRGEFRLGPLTVSSGDPFGLFTSQRQLKNVSKVLVYPMTINLQHFQLPIGILSGGEAQRRRAHYVTTNASGVRDYVPGDSFNRIHWPSSARKDKLLVKEFDIDPLVDIWIFADFSRASLYEDPSIERANGTGPIVTSHAINMIPPSTEEYVATITASLARYFITLERSLGFIAYTPNREIHQPERGNRQMNHILESLAVARSFSSYTLAQMLNLETPYLGRGTTLIIITASVDTAWVKEAQVLGRRGIRPLCVLIDPQSFGGSAGSDTARGMLRVAKIPTILIRKSDDIAIALAQRPE